MKKPLEPQEGDSQEKLDPDLPLNIAAGATLLGGVGGAPFGSNVGGPANTSGSPALAAGVLAGSFSGSRRERRHADPEVEDVFWREQHPLQSYGIGEPYDLYEPAYRAGYEGFDLHQASFEEVEEDIHEAYLEGGENKLPWEKARVAAKAAWERVFAHEAKRHS